MTLPLDGIRVVDLTRYGPGLYCTAMLGDMGADVIRVEAPDFVRAFAAAQDGAVDGDRGSFAAYMGERWHPAYSLNRNKRSLLVDLKTEGGRQVVRDLAARADVLVEGFRPGVAERLGVDYASLSQVNPRLVYCSITGYGQDGPYAAQPGHDLNYVAVGGLLGITGTRDGRPVIPGGQVADFAGGSMHALAGILLALLARQRTGRGQHVDISMTDAVVALLSNQIGHWLMAGGPPPGPGTMLLNGAWPVYDVYETADGRHLAVGGTEPYFWANLCRALGREDLVPLYDRRGTAADELRAELQGIFRTRTRDEWMAFLADRNVCVSPVNRFDDLLRDPQLAARRMFVTVEAPDGRTYTQVGFPIKLSDTPAAIRRLAPAPGQDGRQVLKEVLGYDDARIAALSAAGAVVLGDAEG
ncbi:MAG: CoA transferase [Clostridia bacterium]|nr:CoA transferase [Clostridia bacterium]